MGFPGDDHRHLTIAHPLNEIESAGIGGNINNFIFDTLAIEGTRGRGALDAGGLAVNGDVHFFLTGWETQRAVRASQDARQKHKIGNRSAATTSSLTTTNYASKGGPEPKLNRLDMDFTPKL